MNNSKERRPKGTQLELLKKKEKEKYQMGIRLDPPFNIHLRLSEIEIKKRNRKIIESTGR